MDFCFKKTFKMLIKNPQIVLLLVTYGIISMGLLPLLIVPQEKSAYYIVIGLLFILTMAFFSGWFGCIKYVICAKETSDIEEDIKNRHDSFVVGFFDSVTKYFLQMTFFFVVFVFFVQIVQRLIELIFDLEALNSLVSLTMAQVPFANIVSILPKETINELIKINLFAFFCFNFFFYLNIFVLPALFFNEKNKNPMVAIKNGLLGVIKKPFGALLLVALYSGVYLLNIFLQTLLATGVVSSFILLVIEIYLIAYGVMLLFNIYETNFAKTASCDCDNGAYGFGENKTCD